jgi:hypothetical protein
MQNEAAEGGVYINQLAIVAEAQPTAAMSAAIFKDTARSVSRGASSVAAGAWSGRPFAVSCRSSPSRRRNKLLNSAKSMRY